ncbi:hypothetical protein BH11PSE12_BH11PSE12_27370 [soil metagenome]
MVLTTRGLRFSSVFILNVFKVYLKYTFTPSMALYAYCMQLKYCLDLSYIKHHSRIYVRMGACMGVGVEARIRASIPGRCKTSASFLINLICLFIRK